VSIISRIARIIVFTGMGIAVVGVSAFEGSHIYVEKVAMKGEADGKTSLSTSSSQDPWGWSSDFEEEAWGPASGGTDPRLGFFGRHALRSAWMATHWGSGVAPSLILASDGAQSGGFSQSSGPAPALNALANEKNDGLASAEQYLAACLQMAEDKGIRLPDIAAFRAGLKNAHQSGADAPLDQTAVMLETRLAACRERIGTYDILPLAIAGYERLYDALAATDSAHEAVGHSGHPAVANSRLVRLATKLGDLNAEIGRRDEAEAWLLKAITLAGQGSHTAAPKGSILEEVAGVAGEEPASSSSHKGWFSGWGHSTPPLPSQPAPDASLPASVASRAAVTPTPSLTRSLVSTLLSISGLYAAPPMPGQTEPRDATWRANLEQALRIQASALRLIRLELSRVQSQSAQQGQATVDPTDEASRDLHSLWLKNNEAMVSLHLAETIYALNRSGSRTADAVKSLLSKAGNAVSSGGDGSKGKHGQSIDWLLEADSAAQLVQASLLTPRAVSGKAAAARSRSGKTSGAVQELLPEDLKEQWKSHAQLKVPAERLLRNSGRVRSEAKGMVDALLRKG
jgi:tetratricopeptide (TPR) repeat protein